MIFDVFWEVIIGAAIGVGATLGFAKIWREAFAAKRELHQDLITRLTDRHWSLIASEFETVREWHVYEGTARLASSKRWQRAVQIALEKAGVPALVGCNTCRGMADAVAGEPYARCATCSRLCRWQFPMSIPDRRPTDPGGQWGKQ